jgi:hypothetical protein
MLNDEKRGVEEQYTSAMSTSDLRVEADRRCDADIIIASGWSQGRVGGALMRLHTEYDGSEQPRLLGFDYFMPALVHAAASVAKEGKVAKEEKRRLKKKAHEYANKFNVSQLTVFLSKLKALPDVRTQVTLELVKRGMEDAEPAAVDLIRWWLHQTCPVCNGTKMQTAEGTGRHNGKACPECQGSGKTEPPAEVLGRRTACWMDQCVNRHRATLGRRVHDRQNVEANREGHPPRADGTGPRIFLRPPKKVVAEG